MNSSSGATGESEQTEQTEQTGQTGKTPSRRDVAQVATVAVAANSIEYYDFFLYGIAAALAFPKVFFPEQSPLIGVLLSFATFGVGFVARPLGGLVFGHFGDVVGRKKTLVVAMMLMGVATTAIGLLPSHASVGVLAPVLLVLLRFLQGFSLGGQMGGVVLLATEKAPPNRRGFYGALTTLGSPGGTLLANLAYVVVASNVSPQAFIEWGWRIPFLASLLLVALALYMHFRIEETPAFRNLQQSAGSGAAASGAAPQRPTRSPVLAVLRHHPRAVILCAGIYLGINMTYYVFIAFLITYGSNPAFLGLPKATILTAVLIGSAVQLVALPLAGALSDRLGRRRGVLMAGAAGLGVFSFAFWPLVDTGSFGLITVALVVALGVFHSLMYAVQPTLFAETFSTELRYSGVSLGLQIGALLGGAFAPLVATALVAEFGSVAIAAYMALTCLITLLSVWRLKETRTLADTATPQPAQTPQEAT